MEFHVRLDTGEHGNTCPHRHIDSFDKDPDPTTSAKHFVVELV